MKEINEIISGTSKYIALLINTEYTRITPMIIEAIRSMAAIRSLTDGPLKNLIRVIIIAVIKNVKAMYKTISGTISVIL
jgi:hypothetical protein